MMKTKNKVSYLLIVCFLFIQGCSSKQYFEPKETDDISITIHDIDSTIVDYNSDGATLEDNKFISKNGISQITLQDGYKFLSENDNIVLSSDTNHSLSIYQNGKFETIAFEKNIISATMEKNLIAFSYNDNTINLYDIDTKQVIFKEYLKLSLINDIKISNPIFLKTVILYPTLDGKVVIVDKEKKSILKTINIDPKNDINNIIFFKTIGDSLIAATPKMLFSFVDGRAKTIPLDIKNIAIGGYNIYVSTLDGEILKYNEQLQKLQSKKYKFAKFHTIGFGKYLYALESQGYLVQIDEAFNISKVYDFSFDEEEKVITIDNKLYFEDSYIILD